jgi:hypothetical protein
MWRFALVHQISIKIMLCENDGANERSESCELYPTLLGPVATTP